MNYIPNFVRAVRESLKNGAMSILLFVVVLVPNAILDSNGAAYQWCEALASTKGDVVWPFFQINLADEGTDFIPPGSYKIYLHYDQTDYGYVTFTVNADRRVTSVSQTTTWPIGGLYDRSISFWTDGKVYAGSTIVGSVQGGGGATWNRRVCTQSECSAWNNKQYRPYIALTVSLKHCDGGSSGGGTKGGLNSIHFDIGLGAGTNALGKGTLSLFSEVVRSDLANPARLVLQSSSDFKVINSTNGNGIQQVLSGQILADIVTNNAYSYEVRLYKSSDAGGLTNGLYQPTNSPFKTVAFQNPDGSTNYNRFWITEIEEGITNQYQYAYATNSTGSSNSWELLYPSNLRKDVQTKTWSTNRIECSTVFSVYKPGSPDTLVYQEQNDYQDFGFGDRLIRQIIGTNGVSITNTWEYYTNSSEAWRYGRLKQIVQWDGSWEAYNYDNFSRETNRTSAYLNATNGSPGNLCRVVTTSYASSAPNITRIEKLLDQEVARTYTAFYSASNAVKTAQSTVPGASFSDAGNLATTTTRDSYNRTTAIYQPDLTRAYYTYVTNADKSVTTTMTTGQTNGAGNAILEGTKTITVVGPYGEMVSNIVFNITGGVDGIMMERDSYSYAADDYARLSPTIAHLDGTTTSGSSGCCGSPNTGNDVARDGTTTYYVFDALKRRVSATVNNIASSNLVNALGQELVTMRVGTDASVITNRIAAYDFAGRLIAETNALNSFMLYTNWIDGSGQLIKQTTYADGGTRIETYYRDGQLQSVTGTAVAPVRYVYGVASDGGVQRAYTAEIKLDAVFADASERMTNFVDMVGRNYKTAYSAASGSPFAISYWNNKGQLTNQVDPDGVSQLYAYNTKAEPAYTIMDSNRNYTIDYAGPDRISYVTNDVVNNGTANVRRSRTYVWNTSANTSNLVSTAEASVDGLRSWNTIWNNGAGITNQSRTVYDAANGYRYVTNIAPDNSYSVAITRYGTNVSVTAFDSINNQLSSINYSYDSHGRACKFTDARTGTTTNYFNNADQVTGTATPAPSATEASQVTTNYFDVMGRAWKTVLPDGGVVTNDFTLVGQARTVSGARTYPSGNGYDAQGRFKTLTNWSGFPSTGSRATTWNYDAYRGWLTGKTYPDGTGPSYSYTTAGRLNTRLWARGTNSTYAYNFAGDLGTTYYSDSTAGITNGFDRLGRTTSVTNGVNICNYALNDLGLLLSDTNAAGVLSGVSVTNGFDQLLRRTNLSILKSPSSILAAAAYGYDTASRLRTVSAGTNSATYSYLANSPLVSQVFYTNGSTLRMTRSNQFDNLNRLTNLVWKVGATTVASFAQQFNSANQKTRVTLADGSYWLYQYDTLGQVTSSKKYWSDGTPVAGQQTTYDFDDIGNREVTANGGDSSGAGLRSAYYTNNNLNQITSRTIPGYVEVLGTATNTATVTVNNQATYRRSDYFRAELTATNASASLWFGVTNLAVLNNGTNADIVASTTGFVFVAQSPETFSYDLDGNLTNSGRWTITWDAENRATSFTRISTAPSAAKAKLDCMYDYRWRRTQKIVSTWNGSAYVAQSTNKFVYDGWNLIAILDATNGLVQSFTWGSDASGSLQGAGGVGGLISMTIHQGTNAGTYFYCFDGNHNVTALVNATNGAIAAQYEFDAFGNPLRATGALAFVNPFTFSTKFCDWETGFLYYGYRYYDPSAGRWLSRDPIAESDGPNIYGFVANSPTTSADAYGDQGFSLSPGAYQGMNPYQGRAVNPYPGHTTDPGNPFVYGIKWVGGIAQDAAVQSNNPWVEAMKDSLVMEIARRSLGEHLRAFCKQFPNTVNSGQATKPLPIDFRLGGELPKINRLFYITVVLPIGIITAPRETFIGSWSGGTIKTLSIDCCNHIAKIHIHGINRTGLGSLSHVPDGKGNYYQSFLDDNNSGPMRTVTQTFDWNEDVKF